jgi:hypothetical protein
MSVHATCPKCGEQFRRSDGLAGKLEKCPECKFVFRLPFPARSEPPENLESRQSKSPLQDSQQDAGPLLSANASAVDERDVPLTGSAELGDASDLDQTWPSRTDVAPAAASSEVGSLPQYSSRGRRSSLGRKVAFAVSVVVLAVVSGAIVVIWASSKSDEPAPRGKAPSKASSKSATKPDSSDSRPKESSSDAGSSAAKAPVAPPLDSTRTSPTPTTLPREPTIAERYKWTKSKSGSEYKQGTNTDVTVTEVIKDGKHQHLVKGRVVGKGWTTDADTVMSGPVGDLAIDVPGCRARIRIDPGVGVTNYAGLAFKTPCTLTIEKDCTLVAQEEAVVAADSHGTDWASRSAKWDGKNCILFFPAKDVPPNADPPSTKR